MREEETIEAGEKSALRYLNARPRLELRPSLLALIPFLSSVPLYPPNTHAYSVLSLTEANPGLLSMLMLVACALCGGALAVRSTRRPVWRGPDRGAALVCGFAYLCTQIAAVVCLMTQREPSVMLAALGLTSGALIVPVVLSWVRLYALDLRNAMFHGAIVCAGSAMLTWVVTLLPPLPSAIVLISAAGVGTLTPVMASDNESKHRAREDAIGHVVPSHEGFGPSVRGLLAIIWLPLLGFLVYLCMINIFRTPIEGAPVSTEFVGSIIAAALALGLCLARLRTPLVILVNTLVIPLCVAICIILGSFPEGSPLFSLGAFTVFAPLVFLAIYALASLVVVSAAGEFPQPLVVGAGLLVSSTVGLLSALVSQAFRDEINFGPVTWVIVCCFFATVVAWLGIDAWRKAASPQREQALGPAGDAEGGLLRIDETDLMFAMLGSRKDSVEPNGEPALSAEGDISGEHASRSARIIDTLLARRVASLAQTHELTEREAEILSYLARGFNSTYIASCLLISSNTVRTHIRNIYRKLDVGTRGDLLALISRPEEEQNGNADRPC